MLTKKKMIKILVIGAFAEIVKDVKSLCNNRMYDCKQELIYKAGLHLLENGYCPDMIKKN